MGNWGLQKYENIVNIDCRNSVIYLSGNHILKWWEYIKNIRNK